MRLFVPKITLVQMRGDYIGCRPAVNHCNPFAGRSLSARKSNGYLTRVRS